MCVNTEPLLLSVCFCIDCCVHTVTEAVNIIIISQSAEIGVSLPAQDLLLHIFNRRMMMATK